MSDLITKDRVAYLPDLLYTEGRFESGVAILCDPMGRIIELTSEPEAAGKVVRLKGRAALPGL